MNDEIDYIIDKFNFERVHVAMTAVDWKWAKQNLVPTEVPSVARLKEVARHILEVAYKEKTIVVSGGFYAAYLPAVDEPDVLTYPGEILSLKFVLDDVNSADYHDD